MIFDNVDEANNILQRFGLNEIINNDKINGKLVFNSFDELYDFIKKQNELNGDF